MVDAAVVAVVVAVVVVDAVVAGAVVAVVPAFVVAVVPVVVSAGSQGIARSSPFLVVFWRLGFLPTFVCSTPPRRPDWTVFCSRF